MSVQLIYLDNNATTQVLPEVVEVIAKTSLDAFANPGSRHAAGRAARQVLEASRETVARVLDANPDEVIFTSGATESTNLALFGLARGNGTIATLPGEHPATVETIAALVQRGWRHEMFPIDGNGRLSTPPDFAADLVSLILAHNESGVIQEVGPLIERFNAAGVPTHLDAVQAVGKIPLSFRRLGATALSFGSHKFHGPRGVGGLLVRRGVNLVPLHFGGHQEAGQRPGTEPVPLIAGMAKALELWEFEIEERTRRMSAARDRLEAGLDQACPPVIVHGRNAPRLPNTASVAFPGLDGEALLVALDLEGVACSLGSTCASGTAEPASVLLAMGVAPELALSTVRFSVSFQTTTEEVEEAVRRVARVVRRLRGI